MKKQQIIFWVSIFCLSSIPLLDAAEVTAPESTPKQSEQANVDPALQKAIGQYITAWQKQDFKTLMGYENWEEGDEMKEVDYIRHFDPDFKISDWKVTKLASEKDGRYEVFVLVTHTPPKKILSLVGPGKTVNSTLRQWWKKEGDKFVHLFHVEQKKLITSILPTSPIQNATPPVPAKDSTATPSTPAKDPTAIPSTPAKDSTATPSAQ